MRRYWYWPGWKGGNTKSRVGEGDKVLILGDYLGSQEVGEGEIRDRRGGLRMTEAEEEGEGIGGGDHYEESGCRAWMALALYIAQSTIRLGQRLQNTDEMMRRGGRTVSISLMRRKRWGRWA